MADVRARNEAAERRFHSAVRDIAWLQRHGWWVLALSFSTIAVVFVLDMAAPDEWFVAGFYLFPLALIAIVFQRLRMVLLFGMVCWLLAVVDAAQETALRNNAPLHIFLVFFMLGIVGVAAIGNLLRQIGRVNESAERRARLAEADAQIVAALAEGPSIDGVLPVVLEHIGREVDAATLAILLLRDDQWVGREGCGAQGDLHRLCVPRDALPDAVRAVESGEIVVDGDVLADVLGHEAASGEAAPAGPGLLAPLLTTGDLQGVLAVGARRGRPAFSDDQVSFVASVAGHIAVALENAALMGELETKRRDLSLVVESSLDFASMLEPAEVLESIIMRLVAALRVGGADVYAVDDGDPAVFRVIASYEDGRFDEDQDYIGQIFSYDQFTSTAEAVASGRPLAIENLDDPRLSALERELLGRYDQRAQLTIPLKSRDKVTGVIELFDTTHQRHFTSGEIELAEAICQFASLAMDNADLFDEIGRRNVALRELVEISTIATVAHDVDAQLQVVAKRLVDLLDAADCDIFTLEGDALLSRVSYDRRGFDDAATGHVLKLDRYAVTRRALRDGEVHVIASPDDPELSDSERGVFETWGFTSNVCIPLIVDEQILGVIDVWDDKGRDFAEYLDFLKTVGQVVAAALAKQQLLDQVTVRNRVLRALVELGASIWRSHDIGELVRDVARQLVEATGCKACDIAGIDGDEFELVASYDLLEGFVSETHVIDMGPFTSAVEAIAARKPLVVASADDERLDDGMRDLFERFGYQSEIFLPLVVEDRVVGTLDLYDTVPRDYSEFLDFMVTAGQMIAGAFENASLVERLNQSNRDLGILHHAGLTFGATLDMQEVLDAVAGSMLELADGVACDIYEVSGDTVTCVASAEREGPDHDYVGTADLVEPSSSTAAFIAQDPPQSQVFPDFAHDALSTDAEREEWSRWGYRSGVRIPFVVGGEVLGWAGIFDREVRDYGDLELLQSLAQVAAQALANADLYRQLEKSNSDLEVLVGAGLEFGATLDLDRVLELVATRIREIAGGAMAEIYSIEGDRIVGLVSVERDGVDTSFPGTTYALSEHGIDQELLQTLEPQIVTDRDTDGRLSPEEVADWAHYGLRSSLRVPLVAAGEVIGFAAVFDDHPRSYSSVPVLRGLAQIAARAVNNARLYGRLDDSSRRLRTVNQIGQELSSSLSLETVLFSAAQRLCETARVPCCDIYRIDGDEMVCVSSVKDGKVSVGWLGFRVGVSEWATVAEVIETRIPAHRAAWDDTARSPAEIESLRGSGFESELAVPLVIKDEVVGIVQLLDRQPDRTFSEGMVATLEAVARSTALAISNAGLFEAEREAAQSLERLAGQLQALQDVSLRLNRLQDEELVLNEVVREGARLLHAGSAAYAVRDGDVVELKAFASTTDEWSAEAAADALDTLRRVLSGAATRDDDSPAGQSDSPEGALRCDGSLVVPMRRRGSTAVAALVFSDKAVEKRATSGRAADEAGVAAEFSDDDARLATTLAAQLSLTLRNVRAFQREHRIAEALQDAMLEDPPVIPGVQIGVTYVPAGELSRVGGDFYDVVRLGSDRFMLAIGDVSGHGLEAAVQTAMLRYMLRAYAAESSPGESLSRLNATVGSQNAKVSFVTLLVAFVDVARRSFDYASAGHPRPIIFAGDEPLALSEEGGFPIGMFPTSTYPTNRGVLPADATVVVYTDGITESRREGSLLRADRLERLVGRHRGLEAQDLADTLVERARRFSGGEVLDDMAAVVVRMP